MLATRGEHSFSPLVGNPNLLIRNTLLTVLGLLMVMILRRVREQIFFQNNNFTACKFKAGKEVAISLMVFNLCMEPKYIQE